MCSFEYTVSLRIVPPSLYPLWDSLVREIVRRKMVGLGCWSYNSDEGGEGI